MSRRKQKQPKYAQQERGVMGTDEVSCDDHIKMTEQQSNKNQHAMPTEGLSEANKPMELQRGSTEQSTSYNGGGDPSDRNHSERMDGIQDSLSFRREAFLGYLKDESQMRNDRKNKPSVREFQSRNVCTTESKQAASTKGKIDSPEAQAFSEFTCPACGLYFFNAETYEIHVEKYCIALKYLMKNKALEETYLAVHGNDQKKAYKENIDIQHPTLEKLKNAFYRIQQSLSASRNSQLNDVSDLFCASQPGRNNNTKESLLAPAESARHRSGSTTPDVPNRRIHESADGAIISEDRDCRGGSESSDHAEKAAKRPTVRCVVCDECFSSDSTLRQHVLTKHGSNANAESYPKVALNSSMRPYRNSSKFTKSRRFSTVERPVLSLLTARNRVLPGMAEEEETSIRSPKESDAVSSHEVASGSYSSRPNSRGNSSTHAKLERTEHPQSNFAMKHFHDDDRRMSCPAAPSVNIALESFPFLTDNDEQKHCAECDIKFNSIVNYRAHKKFYCAGRHEQRNGEANPYRSNSIQLPDSSQVSYLSPDFHRQSSRSFGNRTSLPSRKRSHFIPLTSSADGNSEEATDEEPKSKKSDSKSPSIVSQPLQSENEPTPQKRFYCEECKISFSKEDTFIAHKKYYCHTRRKDRTSTRSSVTRNPLRKSSRDSAEGLPSYDRATAFNPFGVNENMWRIRDGERSPSLGSMFPADNFLTNAGCNLSQLFQQQSLVMGNLAMMHPYLMKQYLALREKLPPEIPRTTNNSPNMYLSNFTNNTRKLSADESRLRTHDGYSSTPDLSMKSSRRPARQSCAAAICVKQEDNAWDDAKSGYFREKGKESPESRFPLDLRRNTPGSSGEDEHDRPPSSANAAASQVAKGQHSPNKTADIESDSESQNPTIVNSNSNSNDDGAETSRPVSPKGRGQTCRNCNAQFNSLSTFIAHKKYYCSGISASLQSFSPNPVVVKSESSWGV